MDNDQQQKPKAQITFEVPKEIEPGHYSNVAVVSHSPNEFVIDFANVLPGRMTARVNDRVILSPRQMKRILRILADNLAAYEANFGEISPASPYKHQGQGPSGTPPINMSFNSGEA